MSLNIYRSLLISLFFLFGNYGSAKTCSAAAWYLDNAVSFSGNGHSWATAWKDPSEVVWGTGGVQAGDTLYISGGTSSKTYTATANMMLLVGVNGTAQNPVHIRPGAAEPSPDPSHSGTVIFDGASAYYFLVLSSNPYTYINGIDGNGNRRFKFQNGLVDGSKVCAPVVEVADYGKIQYVEIVTVGCGIKATGTGVEVDHNYIHDVRYDSAIWMAVTGGYDANSVHHNTVSVNYNTQLCAPLYLATCGADALQGGSGITVYNNDIYAVYASGSCVGSQHMDGVQAIGQYYKIYNNTFSDMFNASISAGPPPGIDGAYGHHRYWNNVFRITSVGASILSYQRGIDWSCTATNCSAVDDILIYNNTFVDLNGLRAFTFGPGPAHPAVTNFEIKNNIFYNCGRSESFQTILIPADTGYATSDFAIDRNLVNAGARGSSLINVAGSDYIQPTGWINHPSSTYTPFVAYTEYAPGNDYRLSGSDSVAKDAGFDLSSYLTIDKTGTSRPQGSAWDIGAYEYVQGGDNAPPTAPTGLVVR